MVVFMSDYNTVGGASTSTYSPNASTKSTQPELKGYSQDGHEVKFEPGAGEGSKILSNIAAMFVKAGGFLFGGAASLLYFLSFIIPPIGGGLTIAGANPSNVFNAGKGLGEYVFSLGGNIGVETQRLQDGMSPAAMSIARAAAE